MTLPNKQGCRLGRARVLPPRLRHETTGAQSDPCKPEKSKWDNTDQRKPKEKLLLSWPQSDQGSS